MFPPSLFLVLCFLEKYHFVFSIQGFRYFARILKHGNKWLVGSGSLGPLPFSPSLHPRCLVERNYQAHLGPLGFPPSPAGQVPGWRS